MTVRRRTYCNRFYVYGRGRVLCLSSCRERTPGVPRWKTWANAVRSVDGKHKIYGTNTQCKLQPMHRPSVERTFCNLLYVYGRGRRSSSRTAHRLRLRSSPIRSLRRSSSPKKGEKQGRMPCGRSTGKHYIFAKNTQQIISTHAVYVRRRTFRYNHVYILAVGAGAPTLQVMW